MCKDKVSKSPRRSIRQAEMAKKKAAEKRERDKSPKKKATRPSAPIHHSPRQIAQVGSGTGQSSDGPKFVYTSGGEIDVAQTADTNGASIGQVLAAVKQQFGQNPGTLRIKMPTGQKTLAAGYDAFTDPQENEKQPQALVSYRIKDYGKHKKVGKDFDEWADELSDSDESESEKRKRAKRIGDHLTDQGNTDSFSDLRDAQRAALGGLMLVTHVSDPLRTDAKSDRTEKGFLRLLSERAEGKRTFHDIFGSKPNSAYLPARKGGAAQQREEYRKQDKKKGNDGK